MKMKYVPEYKADKFIKKFCAYLSILVENACFWIEYEHNRRKKSV